MIDGLTTARSASSRQGKLVNGPALLQLGAVGRMLGVEHPDFKKKPRIPVGRNECFLALATARNRQQCESGNTCFSAVPKRPMVRITNTHLDVKGFTKALIYSEFVIIPACSHIADNGVIPAVSAPHQASAAAVSHFFDTDINIVGTAY